jgi:outer membrane protein assembly factor BamB
MKPVSILFLSVLASVAAIRAESWPDPAPPVAKTLEDLPAPEPRTHDRLVFKAAPKPLNKDARTSSWHRFLGPTDDLHSPETRLLQELPKSGPAVVWEIKKGEGYTSPAIEGEFLVFFHALNGRETIECVHPETGKRYWVQDYPIQYRDRYGYANGPRGSPVIASGRVITIGVTSMMTCLDLKTGHIAWQRDLRREFNVPQDFFGHGGSPLVLDGKVIVNVGGKAEPVPDEGDMQARAEGLKKPGLCVGAFDLQTGKLLWGAKDDWGASYASPIAAKLHGQTKVIVFAGGESNPPTGGLLCIDPADGTVHERFAWRAADYISATASTPTFIPDKNRVFISTAYPKGRPLGGVMLEFGPDFKAKEVWKSKKFATHWNTPLYDDGRLYGIDGELQPSAQLVCYDADEGDELWRKEIAWEETSLAPMNNGNAPRMGIQRASLVLADGKYLVLSELGTLAWMTLTPKDAVLESHAPLFFAPHTWCPPAISKGLLYIMQNDEEQVGAKTGQRIICYDLRAP